MLHLLLTLGLALAPNASPTGADRIEALEAAVESGRAAPTLRALAAAGRIEDPRVVKACFQALAEENPRVRLAAIEALRFNAHPGALQVLHSQLRQGAAGDDPAIEAAVVRAVGQHASSHSLSLLAEGALEPQRPVLGRARLLALGRLGTRGAVDALIEQANALPESQRLLFADDLRLALGRATGADHGLDLEAWTEWWNGARARFEPAAAKDTAPTLCSLEWNTYWTSRAALATPAPAPVALPRADATSVRAVEANAKAAGAAPQRRNGNAKGKGATQNGTGPKNGAGAAPQGPAKGANEAKRDGRRAPKTPAKEGAAPPASPPDDGARAGGDGDDAGA